MPAPLNPRVSLNQLCLPGLSPSDVMAAAQKLGIGTVVLCSPDLIREDVLDKAYETKTTAGISVACISHTFAGTSDLERDAGEAAKELAAVVAAAKRLGAPAIYLLTGGRGRLNWSAAADRFGQLVAPSRIAAEEAGISLTVENASALFADFHIAHSLGDAIVLAERNGLGLCIDLFYCWAEAALDTNLERAAKRASLVQVADYVLGDRSLPARAVPGDGVIPIAAIVSRLLRAGYKGVFDLELIGPRIDAEGHLAAAGRAARWLSDLLDELAS